MATAVMVIAMFFIQNPKFCVKDARETFAGAMLHRNCFLFSHDDGDDYKVCLYNTVTI